MSDPSAVQRTIEAVWRMEAARLIGALTKAARDIGAAEELAQEALVAALEQWPREGVPENPGAWLLTIARRRWVDRVRRERVARSAHEDVARERASEAGPAMVSEEVIEDDVLRLIFMACHPSLSAEARSAITLRLVCGLTTGEIARAFLVPEPTIGQRIVRAKRTLVDDQVPFEVPVGPDRAARLASVLEVIYLLFNEGYAATAGEDWVRPALCEEAIRLGRMLAAMVTDEAEVHGLLALMELQASRLGARTDAEGRPILLMDQDRGKWDRLLIRRGLASLERAERLSDRPGAYTLQASIAACHARAVTGEQTDWERIVGLYEALGEIAPSSVVALNHAVAVGMARGPREGLELVRRLEAEPGMSSYHLLPSVGGEFLRRLGRMEEAGREFERAAGLARNGRERELLLARARECERGMG